MMIVSYHRGIKLVWLQSVNKQAFPASALPSMARVQCNSIPQLTQLLGTEVSPYMLKISQSFYRTNLWLAW